MPDTIDCRRAEGQNDCGPRPTQKSILVTNEVNSFRPATIVKTEEHQERS